MAARRATRIKNNKDKVTSEETQEAEDDKVAKSLVSVLEGAEKFALPFANATEERGYFAHYGKVVPGAREKYKNFFYTIIKECESVEEKALGDAKSDLQMKQRFLTFYATFVYRENFTVLERWKALQVESGKSLPSVVDIRASVNFLNNYFPEIIAEGAVKLEHDSSDEESDSGCLTGAHSLEVLDEQEEGEEVLIKVEDIWSKADRIIRAAGLDGMQLECVEMLLYAAEEVAQRAAEATVAVAEGRAHGSAHDISTHLLHADLSTQTKFLETRASRAANNAAPTVLRGTGGGGSVPNSSKEQVVSSFGITLFPWWLRSAVEKMKSSQKIGYTEEGALESCKILAMTPEQRTAKVVRFEVAGGPKNPKEARVLEILDTACRWDRSPLNKYRGISYAPTAADYVPRPSTRSSSPIASTDWQPADIHPSRLRVKDTFDGVCSQHASADGRSPCSLKTTTLSLKLSRALFKINTRTMQRHSTAHS